jgi:hypothetical protein
MPPRKILAETRLSVRDRITVLEKLARARDPWGSRTFLYQFAEPRPLCLTVLTEEDANVRAGAQTVLDWLNGDRHLVQSSQREPQNEVKELLRASPAGLSEPLPETLLRGGIPPETGVEQSSQRPSFWQRLFEKQKKRTRD